MWKRGFGGLVCSSSSGVERPGSRWENERQAGREEAPDLRPWGERYPCFPIPRQARSRWAEADKRQDDVEESEQTRVEAR